MTRSRSDRTSRRALLSAAALASAAAVLGGRSVLRAADEPAAKKRIPIALQLYSVRQDAAKDVAGVIAAVGKMGYEGVEFAGYHGKKAEELRKMLDEANLKCCGTHTGLDTILGDKLKATAEFNKTLGNKFLIVPGLPGKYTSSKQGWLDVAKLFNEAADKAKELDMVVGYHNHSIEFKKYDGELAWEIFGNATKAEVSLQVDFGNCKHGGGDPIAALKKFPGRARTIHLKEYSQKGDAMVGEGEIDWKEVFAFCETAGATEWYIVEQEGYGERTPMQSAEICLKNLKKMGK